MKEKANHQVITIQLKRSLIGCSPYQRAVLNGLGLKKISKIQTLENTPSIRGMIKKVLHLVKVIG